MKILCTLFGHKYKLDRKINSYIKEISCTRCKRKFALNDQLRSILPLDDELLELHNKLKQ